LIDENNELLPPTLRYGDGDAQPGQYSNNNLEWAEPDANPKGLGQRLARKLTLGPAIDPAEGCEIARLPKDQKFPGNIVIKPKEVAETEARNAYHTDNAALGLVIWSDGSKLDTGGCRSRYSVEARQYLASKRLSPRKYQRGF
jgi:hypothetical protein